MWTALAITIVTTMFGIAVWRTPMLGADIITYVYIYGFVALLWVVGKALAGSRERLLDYLGFLLSVAPISLWCLILAPRYGETVFGWLGFIVFGLMSTRITGNLMCHLWLQHRYQRFEFSAIVTGSCVLIAGLINSSVSDISMAEQIGISVTAVLFIGLLVAQAVGAYRKIWHQYPIS